MTTITGVGPTRFSFHTSDPQQSASGRILSLALAADSNRVYAGSYAGVWRSDDAGQTFRQLTGPLTDTAGPGIFGGVYAPHIFDIAASPTDPELVLVAARRGKFVKNRDGIYRSVNGGQSWELVLAVETSLPNFPLVSGVSQIIFAPDDPSLLFVAVGKNGVARSIDAGKTWTMHAVAGGRNVWHVVVAPKEGATVRKVYAAGDSSIFFSEDSGDTWSFDNGVSTITTLRDNLEQFRVSVCGGNRVGGFAGISADNSASCPQILAVEPGNPNKIYLAVPDGSFGPSYYRAGVKDGTLANTLCERQAGEGSLWYGDFSQFASTGGAVWQQLASAPLYEGAGNSKLTDTPSGNVYVITKATDSGFLVFFSDLNRVHVAEGTPIAINSWHRLGGKDASESERDGDHSNMMHVHCDPHALIFTPDFEITLKPASGVSPEYTMNSELDQHIAGRIWMANDGGVYRSDDGGKSWDPAARLDTLDPVNIAGLYGIGDQPALYMGTGDNDDFFTLDGGETWKDPLSTCGDCDAWFADIAQPNRVLQFLPRTSSGDAMRVIASGFPFFGYPDPADPSQNHFVRRPRGSNVSSGFVLRGFRPLIQTLQGEEPLPDGDYVFIAEKVDGTRLLLRTRSISSLKSQAHWDITTLAQQIGPPVPDGVDIAQVGGGHANPVFYVADTSRLFKLDESLGAWKVIVPGGPPGFTADTARRFFVDPYHPELIYLLDKTDIKVSGDSGQSWTPDPFLQQALTASGKINIESNSNSVLNDMLFVRDEPFTRFAFGDAGVFCTINSFHWFPLLDSIAVPGLPESGFFDPVSDSSDRALYVSIEGRSVLRLGGIPRPLVEPSPVYGLLELAAILEA